MDVDLYFTRMHELKNVCFLFYICEQHTEEKQEVKEEMVCSVWRIVVSLPAAYCLMGHVSTLSSTWLSSSSVSSLPHALL